MLQKIVKLLLEQLQVCIFAKIVFGVRCTLNGENICNSNMVVLLHVVQLISRKDQVLNLNSCGISEFYVADCSTQQLQDILAKKGIDTLLKFKSRTHKGNLRH